MTMVLELLRKEVIKPASSSPDHLPTIRLSLFDQFLPETYVSAVFFYDKTAEEDSISRRLKSSLSETLTRYYPLAGRIEGVSVNCNDEGALFTESRVDMLLSDLLRSSDDVFLEQLIASDSLDPVSWPLLHVNVVFFSRGEVAIAVSVSHKICDVHSLMMFVGGWTATAKGCADDDAVINPEFIAPDFYPPADPSIEFSLLAKHVTESRTKRLVFGPSQIKELRSRAARENVTDPTRVEATTALLLKCATKASRSNAPLVMTQAMDLRRRIPSAILPGNASGNFFFLPSMIEGSNGEMKIHEIIVKLRKSKEELDEMIKEKRTIAELGETMASAMLSSMCEVSPEMGKYAVSSWCRKPFYETDFGWGSPVWVAAGRVENTQVILMDSRDGEGIEAWVTLAEHDMLAFERNQELLAFATPNPSLLI